jgi:hypothetical protein
MRHVLSVVLLLASMGFAQQQGQPPPTTTPLSNSADITRGASGAQRTKASGYTSFSSTDHVYSAGLAADYTAPEL